MMLSHVAVEIAQIVVTPIAAVACPAATARLDPGIEAIEGIQKLAAFVFVKKEGGIGPAAGSLAHAVPIGAGIFGKDEYHRLPVVAEIGVTRWPCDGADVFVI